MARLLAMLLTAQVLLAPAARAQDADAPRDVMSEDVMIVFDGSNSGAD